MQMNEAFFRGSTRAVLLRAACLTLAIALLDWYVVGDIPLGFLYLLPMVMVGAVLEPWQIAISAALCTLLAENFDDLTWKLRTGITRDVLYFTAFIGAGLFVREINRNRRATMAHLDEIERQSEGRREAEEQLRVLVESSPAAIITADADGCVLMANEAAHRMLGVPQGELCGRVIHRYLPSLRNVSAPGTVQQLFRSVMQARGQREDGETFLADICFSTYRTNAGRRLAAMVLDASEEFRTQEVSGLHQLLLGSRIAAGAVSHEIRNVCGAITAVHQNLSREARLTDNRDFEALGNLILALGKIANLNLHQTVSQAAEVDLTALLEELRIIIAPSLLDEHIVANWYIDPALPLVWADRSSLMQVFLNLITNSVRALSGRSNAVISISTKIEDDNVVLEIADNGSGVAHPEHLFRPFQNGVASTGLGLFLSRAFLRSFGGEIRYKALPTGACFVVHLNCAAATETCDG